MIRGGVISRIVGRMCQFAAVTLLVPASVALYYAEPEASVYAGTAAAALAVGMAFQVLGRGADVGDLTHREGFLAVVLAWVVMIVVGALPFWISGGIPEFVDAVFESTSGYSTTGATILTDIESLAHAHLFQRSLAHWIGGMGIIVLSVAILPELAVGGMQLFSAEASGISTDKLSPRIVSTARRLWQVYVGLTIVLIFLLFIGGMGWFDAVTHAFGTLATGGFSPKNDSIASFHSAYIESVITIFMLISGMSFALHYRFFVRRQTGALLGSTETRVYLVVFTAFSLVIAATLFAKGTYTDVWTALRASTFQVAAILTTTGFGTANFDLWPDLCRFLLVILMLLGACAGSTAGGVKIVRVLVAFKHAMSELKLLLYPSAVVPVTISGRAVSPATIRSILGFFLLYITTTLVADVLVLAMGVDLVTGVSAVFSAMNSIGPGLGKVGPAGNYADLPTGAKYVLAFCMVAGRLEIYTVIVLFTTRFWRR